MIDTTEVAQFFNWFFNLPDQKQNEVADIIKAYAKASGLPIMEASIATMKFLKKKL